MEHETYQTDVGIWRSHVRALSYNSNKLSNQMQQFYKFITWRFVGITSQTTINNAATTTFQGKTRGC